METKVCNFQKFDYSTKTYANHGTVENARDITPGKDIPLTIAHYLSNLGVLTDQFFEKPDNYKEKSRQRIYLKDIDCPPVWQDKLKDILPPSLFYWNESTGEVGGPGAVNEPMPNGSARRKGKGIAIAGDLMSSLPQEMRAENLMCYIGHEGTYTPSHREMCASLGHNIMVNTSGDLDETSQPEKPGSSIWFMTESRDRKLVSEYWLSVLGHDIEVESHFAQIVAWQKAPFKTYVVEQRVGDFILIPPLAPHQVWNRGTRTMKVAWNRTTVDTLELALHEALPNARLVCRDEQYKNKAIIYYTLMKYSGLLRHAVALSNQSGAETQALAASKKVRQLKKDFKRLFGLYKEILLSEMYAPDTKEHCDFLPFDSNVTCSYCRGNIFNRFLTCKSCPDIFESGTDEPYDICMDCFVLGRSCKCQSRYKWCEQFKWKELLARYDEWRRLVSEIDVKTTGNHPLSLIEERQLRPMKTVAQICQEQLKLRPWVDIKAPQPIESEDEPDKEIGFNKDGSVRTIVKKQTKAFLEKNKRCHNCLKRHPKWLTAKCSMCDRYWCYGSLFRAHDLMPQSIMENPTWECPHCHRVCSTGTCRRDPRQTPYEPTGTLLGHDTKKVADIRSIECLVDFSVSNLGWIKDTSDALESSILRRKRAEAELEKQNNPLLDDRYAHDEDGFVPVDDVVANEPRIEYSPTDEQNELIDPALDGGSGPSASHVPFTPNMDCALGDDVGPRSPGDAANGMFGSTYPEPDLLAHDGFVAPTNVLYHPPDVFHGQSESNFDEANGHSTAGPKRALPEDGKQIKLVSHRKRRKLAANDDPSIAKNKASKQYQQEQDKKALEQARKDGRYLFVWAKLSKKTQIVKLELPSEKLASFKAREDADRRRQPQENVEADVLLRSDIVSPPAKPEVLQDTPSPRAKVTSYKARVEDDEDFGNRGRRATKIKVVKPRFEEIIIDDEDEDVDESTAGDGGNSEGQPTPRRRSSWLARKNEGEEDLPTELPPNYKEPTRVRNRRSDSNLHHSMAQKIPRIRPAPASNGDISSRDTTSHRDTESESSDTASPMNTDPPAPVAKLAEEGSAEAAKQSRKIALTRIAIMEEENRLAKLQAAQWIDGEEAGDSEEEPHQQFAHRDRAKLGTQFMTINKVGRGLSPGKPNRGSPMSKLGHKVKIVSASTKGNGAISAKSTKSRRGPPGRKSLSDL